MASEFRDHARKVFLSAFTHAGIDRACVSLHGRDALVLAYHGIVGEGKPDPFRYHHTVAEFKTHLDWLAMRCTPVNLEEFGRWKRGEWQPRKPPVLVTFDDGYRNNAIVAAPLLKRKGIPALFFLSSGYVESDLVLWPDEVFARVCAWATPQLTGPNGVDHRMPQSPAQRATLALSIVEDCKNISQDHRREFLAYLERETPGFDPHQDADAQAFMTWDDAHALAAAGFDLGSHTVTHPILSSLAPEDLRRELCESRAEIEAKTGRPCKALAYPNGRLRDISGNVVAETAWAGYEYAFTVSNRWCRREANSLQIDRISTPGRADVATFALYASGFREWLKHGGRRAEALPAC